MNEAIVWSVVLVFVMALLLFVGLDALVWRQSKSKTKLSSPRPVVIHEINGYSWVVRWDRIRGAHYYRVTIETLDGQLTHGLDTAFTCLTPDEVDIEPGTYLIGVQARVLPAGRPLLEVEPTTIRNPIQ